MSTASQRKAWNEAMRQAGAKIPSSGSTGRASDRRRKASRRDKARKSSVYGGDAGGSTLEEREFRVAIHLDMLEGVADNAAAGMDDDDDYDEFSDLDEVDKGKKGPKKKRPRKSAAKSKKAASSAKYLRARSLASILIEEANRSDSTAKQYVAAAVQQYDKTSNGAITPYPPRKYCPVTGLFGVYTEPKSQIPYANLMALEQIRERAPPWMNASSSGTATYLEAIKTLRNEP
ncbi:hypothetical protein ACHAWT_009479 [Skeletonema menzelii]|mmetsp:Transcript_19679/g.32290  ORF Transcript_19679/g.32290 Transcript_19679/m.32290 type:complete len:232 (-) Transcript_19679:2437-3132(-)